MKSLFVSILLVSFGTISQSSAREAVLIVPGVGIGKVKLGMDQVDVIRLLGTPTLQTDITAKEQSSVIHDHLVIRDSHPEDGKSRYTVQDIERDDWITPLPVPDEPAWYMSDFLTVWVSFGGRVVQVEVRAPRFRTADGLSQASTGNDFRKAFPDFDELHLNFLTPSLGGIPAGKHFVFYDDDVSTGIAWRYESFTGLAVSPDSVDPPEVIIVHEPGTPVIIDPDGGGRFDWKSYPRERQSKK